MTYPIIHVPDSVSSQLEQLGTKAKFWYWDENGNKVLFKEGRPNTGENWAEKVCCEICRLLELPHAEYDLAIWKGRNGIVTPSFVPADGRLIHGNEVLAKIHEDYDETRRFQAKQHTLRRASAILTSIGIQPPIGWNPPEFVKDTLGVFSGYLLLDALVGNQDRHHENWGLINSLEHGIRLAPTFDHASSLGRNERDETRLERLNTKDYGRSVVYYTSRARSGFYRSITDTHALTTYDAFLEISKLRADACRYWLMKLEHLKYSDFVHIFNEVPDAIITDPAKHFALKMLEVNRARLLKLE